MALSHPRRGPEGDEKPEVERVANTLVEHGRLEADRLIGLAAQVNRDLAQAKKVRVTDQHGASQNGEPAKKEKSQKCPLASRVLDSPDSLGHWPPLPKEQIEGQAGEQDIGAAFHWLGNQFRPRTLEPRACHHAMLDGEEAEQ